MKRILTLSLAILIGAASWARGSTFLDRPYGTPELGLSARARAMGGTGAALDLGPSSLVDNPAALTLASRSSVQLTSGVARASENRFVPLFDTFDSYVDETAIAVNDHLYGSLQGGVLLDPRWRTDLILAAGLFERYDPRYDYGDERRTTATTDQIVAERFIRTRGILRSVSVGAALALPHGSAVGLALHGYFGTLSERDALVPRASGISGRVLEQDRRLSGVSVALGGLATVNERLTVGVCAESGPRLHDDYTAWRDDSVVSEPRSSGELRLPYRLQAGAAYRPRNTHRTTFALDVVYMPWSEVDDDLVAQTAPLDTWDVRFGLEHVYYNALPGRIGFRYARSYALREADRATFTFGVGYRVERFRLDLAGEVGRRNSRQEPLWPRDEQGPAVGTGRDRVEDTVARVTFGVEADF
jgi:long-subunit fatty acid transport protein